MALAPHAFLTEKMKRPPLTHPQAPRGRKRKNEETTSDPPAGSSPAGGHSPGPASPLSLLLRGARSPLSAQPRWGKPTRPLLRWSSHPRRRGSGRRARREQRPTPSGRETACRHPSDLWPLAPPPAAGMRQSKGRRGKGKRFRAAFAASLDGGGGAVGPAGPTAIGLPLVRFLCGKGAEPVARENHCRSFTVPGACGGLQPLGHPGIEGARVSLQGPAVTLRARAGGTVTGMGSQV